MKDSELAQESGDNAGLLSTTVDGSTAAPHEIETEPSIPGHFILNKIDFDSEIQSRYQTGALLGSGGGGAVYDLVDANLKRTIAAKFLPKKLTNNKDKVSDFMHEALVTSRLDHPNIPPIYDLEALNNNQIFYTMKKIDGNPLSQYIEMDKHSTCSPDTLNNLITIFIKVCEAIAYAHSRHIIHRDIKPANIMLGKFGEVRIVDWGIAIEANDPRAQNNKLSGTPIYMSPEQANRMPVDERSDIYATGASLFHVLFKRPPIYADNLDDFWSLKKSGTLRAPSPQESKNIPRPLIAICLKCIAYKAEDRYPDVASLIDDLKQFQNGGSIWAYNYSIFELLKHWAVNNTSHLKWLALVLVILGGAALFAIGQYQRQYAGWGDPVYSETFNDAQAWHNNWTITTGNAEIQNNTLVTQHGLAFCAFYNKPIEGGVSIEFTGKMLAGFNPGDLSIVFTPDLHNTLPASKTPTTLYYLQSGAHGNECAAIAGPHGRIDYKRQTLKIDQSYRIRGEIDGAKLRLFINDIPTCSYDLLLPLTSGYIGIYGYYPGKAFDDITIYNKSIPELTNAIKTGDIFFENELYQLAADRYEKIKSIHEGTALGNESNYKLGLCYYKMDQKQKAFAIWAQQQRGSFKHQIAFHYWNDLYLNNQQDSLLQEMTQLFQSAPATTQRQIKSEWASLLKRATAANQLTLIKNLLAFRSSYFPDDQVFSHQVFGALRLLGECQEALTLYPDQEVIIINALLQIGHYDDVISRYPLHRYAVSQALLESGNYQQVITDYSDVHETLFHALLASNDYQQAAQIAINDGQRANILLAQEKYNELIQTFPKQNTAINSALLQLGKFDDVLNAERPSTQHRREALLCKNLLAYFNQDAQALATIKEIISTIPASENQRAESIFTVYFLDAVLEHFEDKTEVLQKRCDAIWSEKKQMLGMRLWHCAGLLSGKISEEEFLQQPKQHGIQRDHFLYKALHEDLYGDKNIAKEYYLKLEALPNQTPSVKILCAERLKVINND